MLPTTNNMDMGDGGASGVSNGGLGMVADTRGRRKGAKGLVRVAVDRFREWVGNGVSTF